MATNTTASAPSIAPSVPVTSVIGAAKSRSLTQDAWRRFIRNKASLSGLVFVGIIVFLAIAAPLVAPYGYAEQNLSAVNRGPGAHYLLGTDGLGRDVLSRMIYGARISMMVGLVIPLMIILIGVPVGLIAGFFGKGIDTFLMRI